MPYDDETRYRLKKQICRSLRVADGKFTYRDGRLREWFVRHLEGLAAYAYANKSEFKEWQLDAMRLHFVDCRSHRQVAEILGVAHSTVTRTINAILDRIIEQMPQEMAIAILQADNINWKLNYIHETPRFATTGLLCGGPMYWEPDPLGFAQWVCTACSKREETGDKDRMRRSDAPYKEFDEYKNHS